MNSAFDTAIRAFGALAKTKLTCPSANGQPEDQLRAPFENLLASTADILDIRTLSAIGETSLAHLKIRPDYSITVNGVLAGFIEMKAPGKGADPRKFRDPHDKSQWEKLRSLPNLLYTDGNAFSLWQSGELVDAIVTLDGDIETSGSALAAPPTLLPLLDRFLRWEPIPPRNAKELARFAAYLCRFLRDEVTEQLAQASPALTGLATDWRKLLFPDASDEHFADGYAQAVTFGLLMARAKGIALTGGLQVVAATLSKTNSLIGTALRLLTDSVESQATLPTSLSTLTRVLDAVNWSTISRGKSDAWLYFYEDFLEIYDNDLRKLTGSYYTPPEVVETMTRLVDDILRSPRFNIPTGLASPSVALADPATGTGTFLLGVLRKIADTIETEEGPGAVSAAIDAAIPRLIAFEMQLGPFAVAQLRILAEIVALTGSSNHAPLSMFVTDTLSNPRESEDWIPNLLAPIADSRKQANRIKRDYPITVVLGNPPYKNKAKGRGGWIENGDPQAKEPAPLADWMPPREWGVSAHAKHLRDLYIYFWRWATHKVFDHGPGKKIGVVGYITLAGFLAGPGFQKMRDYLRRTCDDIWVIDCSPEGHQPDIPTRIFQGVQQPVCIVIASRSAKKNPATPANVRFHALPAGTRGNKFAALAKLRLDNNRAWTKCPADWRAPFLPASKGAWATYPKFDELFAYNASGTMPGRTWIIAPDAQSLEHRWQKLITAPDEKMNALLQPHRVNGKPGDRHAHRIVQNGLPGYPANPQTIAQERGPCLAPFRYGFRSFDRQWIIPDNRVINRPNPELWALRSDRQLFLNAHSSPTHGPALTLTNLIPDINHYNGRGGRVFPLWSDSAATQPNLPPKLLPVLKQKFKRTVAPEDFVAYITAVAAHPAYTARFQADLSTPGLRIPVTARPALFAKAAALGRTVIWLHTFGERMADPSANRPARPPRLPSACQPKISKAGAIPQTAEDMPDILSYDVSKQRLVVGTGFIDNVPPAVWNYEISGKQVLVQWFSYRRKNRERPIIGDRRPPSPLCDIQPDHWLPEYTTELLNLLNILGWLVELEPEQAGLLEKICAGPTISEDELRTDGALEVPPKPKRTRENPTQPELFT